MLLEAGVQQEALLDRDEPLAAEPQRALLLAKARLLEEKVALRERQLERERIQQVGSYASID